MDYYLYETRASVLYSYVVVIFFSLMYGHPFSLGRVFLERIDWRIDRDEFSSRAGNSIDFNSYQLCLQMNHTMNLSFVAFGNECDSLTRSSDVTVHYFGKYRRAFLMGNLV